MQLAPLTFHAVPLGLRFSSMETALDAFCEGSSCLTPRERQALFACVVSMFFHWHDFQYIDLNRYLQSRESSARLAYACLVALHKKVAGPEKEILKNVFRKVRGVATSATGPICSLFNSGCSSVDEKRTGCDVDPEAAMCGIVSHGICRADIIKMVDR